MRFVDIWQIVADRKIQEAMEDGAFNRLEGTGRPLPEDNNPYEDPAQRMAHRLMKNAGITPEWIAEGREIDREIRRPDAATPEERRSRIAALNQRIALFNLKTPVRATHKPPLRD